MRGHIEPVPAVGREPQVEPEGVRRVLPAGRLRAAVGTAGHGHLRPVQQHGAENPNRYVYTRRASPQWRTRSFLMVNGRETGEMYTYTLPPIHSYIGNFV